MKRLLTISVGILLSASLWAQVEKFNLENPAVQAFMADRTYDSNSDYSVTVIENYNTDEYYADRDRPLPVMLSWEKPTEGYWMKVVVSETPDFSRIVHEEEQRILLKKQNIYNLIPGRTYYYRLEYREKDSEEYTVFQESSFQTTGQVRMLKIDGMSNVRDLGGWATSFGRPLNYGIIFRNARTDEVTMSGATAYKALGMAAELDLRDDSELTSSPLGEEVDYIRLASTAQYSTGIKNDWQPFVNDFNWIVSRLRQGKVLNFHCTAGADRTGTLAWLLEGLLGVSEADLSRDFELTTFDGTWGSRPRNYDPGKGNLGDMLSYIRTFGSTNDLAGCFYNYWINRGVKADDIAFFRHLMIDEYVPVSTVVLRDAVVSLGVGDCHAIMASVMPSDATYTNLRYSSSDNSVITVTADGLMTAVGAGNAYVVVSSIKGEASAILRVHVAAAAETCFPDEVVVADGNKLKVYTTSEKNYIPNGSFEYNNSNYNWFSGASDNINTANFEFVSEDAPDGNVYVRALRGDVSASSASILTSWRLEQNKTYAFGYKVKNALGNAVVADQHLQTSLVALDSEATGSGSDLGWGDDDDDDVLAKRAVAVDDEAAFVCPSYNGDWTDVQYVFKSGKNLYLKIDFSQLVDENHQVCLDGFYLVEIEPKGDVDGKDYLSDIINKVTISNYGTEAFQHPLHRAEALKNAVAVALNAMNGTAEDMAIAATSLGIALKNYEETPLNAPAADERFNVLRDGRAAYWQAVSVVFADENDAKHPIPFLFATTGERDCYTMSFEPEARKTLFVTFDDDAMTTTDNGADAQVFIVRPTNVEGIYEFLDADGLVLFSAVCIRKAAKQEPVDGSGSDLGWGDDDDDDFSSIIDLNADDPIVDIYSPSGLLRPALGSGVNIVVLKSGRRIKIM